MHRLNRHLQNRKAIQVFGKNPIHCAEKRAGSSVVDGQRILYRGQYLSYFDIGRHEYWRASGLYETIYFNVDPAFHVTHVEVNYLNPCSLDEMISIFVRVNFFEDSPIKFEFELRAQLDAAFNATGREVHVHVDTSRRPHRIGDAIGNKINAFQS